MADNDTHKDVKPALDLIKRLPSGVRRRVRLTQGILFLERFTRAFWPAMICVLLAYAFLRWTVLGDIPEVVFAGICTGFAALFAIFCWRGFRRFVRPNLNDAIFRLDQTLDNRPLAALLDDQAIGANDPQSRKLWEMHQNRMQSRAQEARVPEPDLRLARFDPYALRLMALVAFVASVAFAPVQSVRELVDGITGDGANALAGPSFEGWAEPPFYTKKPSIYLNDARKDSPIRVPVGTEFTLRFYGDASRFSITESVTNGQTPPMPSQEDVIKEMVFVLEQSGKLSVEGGPKGAQVWEFAAIPDLAPQLVLTDEISRSLRGSMTMPYHAKDDYGVVGGQIRISLRLEDVDRRYGLRIAPEPRAALALDLQLPFGRDLQDFEDSVLEELAKHPWAGLPVTIEFEVIDDVRNVGAIEPERVEMPGKRFFDRLAGGVVELRRDILWNRENAPMSALYLRAMTHRSDDLDVDENAFAMLRDAIGQMENGPLDDTQVDTLAELLWEAALIIEEGDIGNAAERLKRAQERLEEAMKNGATPEEIQELMDELQRATDEYIRELAENQDSNQQQQQQSQNGQTQEVTPDMLQEMRDRIQELMEQGRMAEAQELLQQYQQMMENMQVQQGQQGEGGQSQQGQQQGRQGLSDTLQEQQGLADDTFRERQEEFARRREELQAERDRQAEARRQQGQRQGDLSQENESPDGSDPQNGQNQGQEGDEGQEGQGNQQGNQEGEPRGQGGGQQTLDDLADRQSALREMLRRQQNALPNDQSEAGQAAREALERAEQGMADAEQALREGDTSGALDRQADAMDELRNGLRDLDRAEAQARGETQGSQGEQQADGEDGMGDAQDPLGRPRGQNGNPNTNQSFLEDDREARRNQEVLDEIRRRSGEQGRPKGELDYLKRLLDRF